jgi:hypothetical protein
MARFSAIRIPSISKTPKRAPGKAIRTALAATMLASAAPAFAADVTPERLLNPDREPQNWLMNHRTYDGQRFSPLARIDKGNVKNLKLAMRSRSADRPATNGWRRRRCSKTASSMSPIRGACSTRSMPPRAKRGESFGAWSRSRNGRPTIRGAADDLRVQRQTICGDCLRAQPARKAPGGEHPRAISPNFLTTSAAQGCKIGLL